MTVNTEHLTTGDEGSRSEEAAPLSVSSTENSLTDTQQIEDLQNRVASIEEKIARFEKAFLETAKKFRKTPMISMMMPKEMKEILDKL